ncbi:Hemocyanin N domain containing protein, partial [Asbolus verrucosus]
MTDKKKLLLLFDRPQEPSFMVKGDKYVFDVPNNSLPEKYKPIGVQLFNKFGEDASERIPVKEISPPNLDDILELGRHENFSLFVPKHRRISGKLIRIFLAAKDVDDLLATAVYVRDRVNPYLFNYTFSVALLHRSDTQNLDLPSFIHTFPDKYIDSQVFAIAREEANIVPEGNR